MPTRVYKNINDQWALEASIDIDAPPEVVWQIMTDFDHTGWASTGVKSVDGDFKEGGRATVVFRLLGLPLKSHRVLKVNPGQAFGWQGKAGPGLHDDHAFELIPLDDGKRTKVVQTDIADGPVGRLLGPVIARVEVLDYMRWNKSLKRLVETFQAVTARIEAAEADKKALAGSDTGTGSNTGTSSAAGTGSDAGAGKDDASNEKANT